MFILFQPTTKKRRNDIQEMRVVVALTTLCVLDSFLSFLFCLAYNIQHLCKHAFLVGFMFLAFILFFRMYIYTYIYACMHRYVCISASTIIILIITDVFSAHFYCLVRYI